MEIHFEEFAFTGEYSRGYKNTYVVIKTVIPCLGGVFLRASVIKDLVRHRPRFSGLKPHFCVPLDSPADYHSDIRTALPEQWRRSSPTDISGHEIVGAPTSHKILVNIAKCC